MSFAADEDILLDFLMEAGEILELLQEQLLELENNPQDADLLNAIFRGYHTVKGGAGFLALTELVEICHGAENVFDVMRNNQRCLTPDLMDAILQATDAVVDMFETVKAREPLQAAPPLLIELLHKFSKPEYVDEQACEQLSESLEQVNAVASHDACDNEIDSISEDEFEALLDDLHGVGSFNVDRNAEIDSEISKAKSNNTLDISPSQTNNEEISDDDFEALLDDLHGKGNAPSSKDEVKTPNNNSDSENELKHGISRAKIKTENQALTSILPIRKQEARSLAFSKSASLNKKADSKASSAQGETTVRVDTKRLDQIMNMVGELVLVRNRILSLGVNVADECMTKAIANLDLVTGDLQGAVMKTRMQPIKKVFGRFPRVVRDLARTLNKEISLVLEGEDTDLDKNLVEALADPLVHLVRNSVDHGIEMPDERAANGKARTGIVTLAASQEGDHILLTIADDGKGMDAEKLKEIAIKRSVLDADTAARMSDEEAYNLIFAPGFSTKTEISDISGRGVGMDVVKTKIKQLHGSIRIKSKLGEGTRLEIKVPLTLAILPTLMIVVGKQTFALPLGSVKEIINMDFKKTNTVNGQFTMIVRSKAIPLFFLNDWLNPKNTLVDKTIGHIVVVQIGTKQIGFVVDALIGQEEVVIKPLDALLQGTPGMAGATITSDGGIALILDIPSLLKRYV